MTQVYFRQPNWTARIKGERNVGRTTDYLYTTEACIDPQFGDAFYIASGSGDTAAEAKSEAARKCIAAEKRHYETGQW